MWKWILGGAAAYLVFKGLGGSSEVLGVQNAFAPAYGVAPSQVIVTKTAAGAWQVTINGQVVATAPTLAGLAVASGDPRAVAQQIFADAYKVTLDKVVITQDANGAYVAVVNGQTVAGPVADVTTLKPSTAVAFY